MDRDAFSRGVNSGDGHDFRLLYTEARCASDVLGEGQPHHASQLSGEASSCAGTGLQCDDLGGWGGHCHCAEEVGDNGVGAPAKSAKSNGDDPRLLGRGNGGRGPSDPFGGGSWEGGDGASGEVGGAGGSGGNVAGNRVRAGGGGNVEAGLDGGDGGYLGAAIGSLAAVSRSYKAGEPIGVVSCQVCAIHTVEILWRRPYLWVLGDAKHLFDGSYSPDKDVPVTVYARKPGGPVQSFAGTLTPGWRLTSLTAMASWLSLNDDDRVCISWERVAADGGGGGDAAGACMAAVVEKVAEQQQGRHGKRSKQGEKRRARMEILLGPLRGPAGPSDGTDPSRVVMSSARITYNRISITACVLPHLVEASCIEAAKAAELAEDGRRITYLLKLYARKRGENGPPEPFQGVALRPQCNGMKTSLSWVLAKLGALRNYLGLERGASVWLVREALADGTVAVVVEPCDEQGCRGGAAGSEAVVLELSLIHI